MGAACCIAAKNKNTGNGSSGASANVQIHSRYSPSWSFRWDNRGRVAGEDTSVDWLDSRVRENDRATLKSSAEATLASDDGSLLDSFRSVTWQKSPPSQGNDKSLMPPSSGPGVSRNPEQVKEPSVLFPSPRKFSPSVPSVSSMSSSSPLSFHGHLLLPANATPSRWLHCSPAPEFSSQVSSDSRIPEHKSLTFSISEDPPSLFPSPAWANESTGGSLDSWSIPEFSDLAVSARRERWSFDSGTSSFSRRKSSGGASFDLQTCGICAKLLRERSSWRWAGQKAAISSSEIAVVSVLTCGHVYHGECLEYLTPDVSKYDPSCPVCTFGERMTLKMWEKALMESKAKRRSRRRVVDGDPKGSSAADNMMMFFDPLKGNGSTTKQGSTRGGGCNGKPFLKRHFSFVSRSGSKSVSENQSAPRKALFWAKSSKY